MASGLEGGGAASVAWAIVVVEVGLKGKGDGGDV